MYLIGRIGSFSFYSKRFISCHSSWNGTRSSDNHRPTDTMFSLFKVIHLTFHTFAFIQSRPSQQRNISARVPETRVWLSSASYCCRHHLSEHILRTSFQAPILSVGLYLDRKTKEKVWGEIAAPSLSVIEMSLSEWSPPVRRKVLQLIGELYNRRSSVSNRADHHVAFFVNSNDTLGQFWTTTTTTSTDDRIDFNCTSRMLSFGMIKLALGRVMLNFRTEHWLFVHQPALVVGRSTLF